MHVYVTIKALESMALMTRWIKILSCRDVKEVFLDATKEDIDHYYENYDEDYSYINDNSVSPISQLIRDGYISPNPAKQKILDIKNSPEKVLEDPSAIYFLDVTTEEAVNFTFTFRQNSFLANRKISVMGDSISSFDAPLAMIADIASLNPLLFSPGFASACLNSYAFIVAPLRASSIPSIKIPYLENPSSLDTSCHA